MKKLSRRLLALTLAVLLVATAATGGGMADTPTIDTETSTTTETSDVQSGTVVSDASGLNDTKHIVSVLDTDTDTPELEITINGSDTVVATNDSATNVTHNATADQTTFNMSVLESDLDDVERTVNENVTLDWMVFDSTNESNETTIQVHFNYTDERTVENLDDVDADPDTSSAPVETESLSESLTRISSFDIHTLDFSDLDIDDRAVNGEETDVVIVFSNGTVNDHAADAVPDDVSDGDPMYGLTLVVAGDEGPTQPIRVYHEEAPDSVDEDDDTYGVYHDGGIGGEDGVVINLGDEYDDEEEVSVTGRLNAGRIDQIQHRVATTGVWQSVFGALSLDLGGVLTGSVPTITFGAIAVRRRRLAG